MKDANQLPKDLGALMQRLQQGLQDNALLRIAGVEAVRETQQVFDDEAFEGNAWPARRDDLDPGRNLLVDSGALKDEVRYDIQNEQVFVGVDLNVVPYAQIHNEGGEIPVTPRMRAFFFAKLKETNDPRYKAMALARQITIPQRQYLGVSNRLKLRISKAISQYLKHHVQAVLRSA